MNEIDKFVWEKCGSPVEASYQECCKSCNDKVHYIKIEKPVLDLCTVKQVLAKDWEISFTFRSDLSIAYFEMEYKPNAFSVFEVCFDRHKDFFKQPKPTKDLIFEIFKRRENDE